MHFLYIYMLLAVTTTTYLLTHPHSIFSILSRSPHHHHLHYNMKMCVRCSVFATHYCRNFPFLAHTTPLFSIPSLENQRKFCLSSLSSSLKMWGKKRARKPLRRKSIKGFFSEATFHIHKFSTFSPYSTCLLAAAPLCY